MLGDDSFPRDALSILRSFRQLFWVARSSHVDLSLGHR
jgi:hypothetical protein